MDPVIRLPYWLRTKRQLADRNADLSDIVTKQIDELARLHTEIEECWASATAQTEQQRRVLAHTQRLLDAHEAKNAALREELARLLEDIRRAEEIEHPPTAGGTGMVRPLAQRNPMADRILRRPWPADLADVLAQETAMKRRLDGLGDE